MPITMSQAERLICEHLSKGGETASARLRSQRTFFDFIAEGMLHPTSSQGEVRAFRVYPPDEQHPARLLYDWDSPQEVWAAPALVNILDEFDFDEGTMITLPSDTSSDAFPWPWRGGPFVLRVNAEGKAVMGREAVVISLKGVTVDRSELLRCIALWEEDSKAQPTNDQGATARSEGAERQVGATILRPVGRPNVRDTVADEMKRRAKQGEINTQGLRHEALALSGWLPVAFPNDSSMRMSSKSIETAFCGPDGLYRQCINKLLNNP